MKYSILFLFLWIIIHTASAQKQASNWYFGDGAGVKFNDDGSVTELTDGRLNTFEGCTSISDANGNLLFYTDGITVYNKNHQAMPGATGLANNKLLGDPSSTQSAIIVPKPGDENIYYIFTVDTITSEKDVDTGFNYSIVDLTLDNGLGDIVSGSKNINLLADSSEKLSAVLKDCQSETIWVITLAPFGGIPGNVFDTFYAYEISAAGINTTPVISTINTPAVDPRGYLKFSPNGSKIACANSGSGLFLYDFDQTTGVVSNETAIPVSELAPVNIPLWPYGVEFSPNNELLYVSAFYNNADFSLVSSALLQYNLTESDIASSEFLLDKRDDYRGALQLGPDGKIYKAMSNNYDLVNAGVPFLSVINNPNEIGTAANYQYNGLPLTRNSRQGLPPFITSFFSEKIDIINNNTSSTYLPLCTGESYTLVSTDIPGADYIWKRDGVVLAEKSFSLTVTQQGFYEVLIESNSGSCGEISGEALVEYFEFPSINQPNDIVICKIDNGENLDVDLTVQNTMILDGLDPNDYLVSYYLSQTDADLQQNEILSPYTVNSASQHEIFIRLELNGNTTSCFDTSKSFFINVFNTPIANAVSNDFIACDFVVPNDLDVFNGQTNIDLNQFDAEIYGSQNSADYAITYYSSTLDAANKTSPLNNAYYNQTPFTETIYARIENVLNPDCFDISQPINIVVNPLPEFTNISLLQCDEDGIKDNITIFNLTEASDDLTNSETNRSVAFFENLADAEISENAIVNPEAYKNQSNSQTVFAQITDTETGCFSIAQLTIETSSTQLNNYMAPAVCDENNSEDGINMFDLNTITADIQSLNNITFPITYYESYEDALTENNGLNSNFQNTVPYSQTIYARAENNNNCYGIAEVLLTINRLPSIENTIENTFYCLNTYPEKITLDADIPLSLRDSYTYSWSNGDVGYQTQINEVGSYKVTVTDMNGCSKDKEIIVEPSNVATIESINITDLSENNMVEILVSGEGEYQYSLIRNGDALTFPFQDSNVFENVYPGIYTAAIRDTKNNCGTIFDSLAIVGFPKFFTPNNDGYSDTWQVYGVSSMFQPDTKIQIFDRYGKLIKELTPFGDGWDGLLNGQKLPSDDYWFSVRLQDGRIFKNHFTLKY